MNKEQFIKLVLSVPEKDNGIVACDDNTSYLFSQFVDTVFKIASALKKSNFKNWLLFFDNSYEFAVTFFAVLLAKHNAIIVPNTLPNTIQELESTFDAILTDNEPFCDSPTFNPFDLFQYGTMQSEISCENNCQCSCSQNCDFSESNIILFTSGSSGKRKVIIKNFHLLNEELKEYQYFWQGKVARELAIATVSHQHIYGLLHKIIYPITHLIPFYNPQIFFPNQLLEVLKKHNNAYLLSSPAFLKRLPDIIDLSEIKDIGNDIFSAGGAIPHKDAMKYYQAFGTSPLEIYGSTETGGIGWNRKIPRFIGSVFKTFHRVEVKTNDSGTLMVRSPFINTVDLSYKFEEDWYRTDDLAKITEDGFIILGRNDRVVKIEDKRVSLTQVETSLLEDDLVADVAVVLLSDENTASHTKDSLAVAVVLNPKGQMIFEEKGKNSIVLYLKEILKSFLEPTILPRMWRFVDEIPQNTQGKRDNKEIISLFK